LKASFDKVTMMLKLFEENLFGEKMFFQTYEDAIALIQSHGFTVKQSVTERNIYRASFRKKDK